MLEGIPGSRLLSGGNEMAGSAAPASTPAISGDAALRIAHADAERVYRDLSAYRIILALEADGWHIDYNLKSPTALGGGPRYIIDAMTGAFVLKRYQQ